MYDAQGQFVPDLRAEEVRVLENGEPRELAGFERDERPLAAVLVLDTSAGAAQVFRTQAFDAVWTFVSRLPAGAKCTLWTSGDRPHKLGALEGERKDVDKKVGQGFALEGANALMDTVVEAAVALARESGKRRALVVLSGAGAGHTTYSPADVTAQTRKAGAPVFALMYDEGEAATAGSLRLGDTPRDAANLTIVGPSDHERVLSGLAQATGGRFERVAVRRRRGHALRVHCRRARRPVPDALPARRGQGPEAARGAGGPGGRALAASPPTAPEENDMKKLLVAGCALVLLAGLAVAGLGAYLVVTAEHARARALARRAGEGCARHRRARQGHEPLALLRA